MRASPLFTKGGGGSVAHPQRRSLFLSPGCCCAVFSGVRVPVVPAPLVGVPHHALELYSFLRGLTEGTGSS